MARYTKREFQLGEFYLGQRGDSPAWYRCWIDGGRTRRVSLGTDDFETAKEALKAFFIDLHTPKLEEPERVPLADLLDRYHSQHGSKVRSSSSSATAHSYWKEYWKDASVEDLRDVRRQEAFHGYLRGLGLKDSSVQRVITIGKAAVNRAYKRGEIAAVPYILTVKAGAAKPMGRPMEVAELRKLYAAAQPHLKVFIGWMLGTAARTEAIIQLTSQQVEWGDRLINLNPSNRTQTKKFRPTVRLIPSLEACGFEGHLIVAKSQPVQDVKNAWRAARKAAGLDDRVTSYSLRHTAARWMRREGVSEWDTATQLGHRRPGVTERYTAYDPAYLKGAGAALDKLVTAVVDEWPTWGRGVVKRGGYEIQRVGWYPSLPDDFSSVLNRQAIPATEPQAVID